MQRLLLLGLNHSTAPLEVRERLAFTAPQRREALRALRCRFPDAEAVLLSTCNRVELYVARPVHGRPRPEEMLEFVSTLKNVPSAAFDSLLYQKAERETIEHLFSVASSLTSMVVGETQILGQVRDAYESARDLGLAGGALNPLFQKALAVGKQVLSQTPIAEGRMSVASVAVACASRIFENFHDKTVLNLGAGKMAAIVLQSFAQLRPKRLLVVNRDPEKGRMLASRFGGEAAAFEHLDEHLIAADIVITSTASSHPIITKQRFEHLLKQRRYRPVFLIDIAMPRDIEAAVGNLENVYLYNLDDLQQVVSATCNGRSAAIEQARAIVLDHVEKYVAWTRAREMGPMIDQLYRKHHELAREELERTLDRLPDLSAEQRAHLEELTRRLVNKFLHDPIRAMRESGTPHAQNIPYLHALEKLFQLTQSHDESADGREDI